MSETQITPPHARLIIIVKGEKQPGGGRETTTTIEGCFGCVATAIGHEMANNHAFNEIMKRAVKLAGELKAAKEN